VPGTDRERIAIDRGGLMPDARTIEIRGGAVTFKVLAAGRGAPLVYFHSYFERSAWSPFLDLLARSFSVFAPAHPGVAGSSGIETLDDLLDLTLAYDELFTALGVERAHLVGHSFGAMAAAELAAVFPVRAQSLTLASPLGLWRDDAPPADILILPADELAAVLWRDPTSRVAVEWAAGSGGDPEDIAAQVESLQRRSSMAKFVWPIPDKGLRRRLHRIAAPTLLVWGDEDRANPVVYAEEWQRRIKGAALRLLPGGHMVLHETPEPAARAVVELARS
jgi:pimeloyl-ACP methyl ester carboxylesterase